MLPRRLASIDLTSITFHVITRQDVFIFLSTTVIRNSSKSMFLSLKYEALIISEYFDRDTRIFRVMKDVAILMNLVEDYIKLCKYC